ncbi:MAG: N-6 DNA methylase [Victivallales bacterium]|nr:N-6 DNA methylase [Victivallales bacterium]
MTYSLEHNYLSAVGIEHRKRFAQFFTPKPIACFMNNWVLEGGSARAIFDPAFGLGAFAENAPSDVSFSGIEVDSKILEYYASSFPGSKAVITHDNYLLRYGDVHENIVCNPPYLKFQKFEQKETVLKQFEKKYGIKLSGYTNIASAFLVKSILELRPGGRLAYIMPIEFLNTGYGRQIKELLIHRNHLFAIIKIECETEAFPDATTSLCILLYHSSKRYNDLSFITIHNLEELEADAIFKTAKLVSYNDLNVDDKWMPFFENSDNNLKVTSCYAAKLSLYGHFSRGIATGSNGFFVLKKSIIDRLNLPSSECSPCITKSAQITKPIFVQEDFDKLSSADAPVYLLNVGSKHSRQADEYISFGEKTGVNNGYITRSRTPWYKMEKRLPAPILLNVFSRGGYKVIRNMSNVQSLTSFHCFYPNLFGELRVNALFLYLFSDIGHRILASSIRKYGNNLDKFEPNDLNEAIVPSEAFLDSIPSAKIEACYDKLSVGENIEPELNAMFGALLE